MQTHSLLVTTAIFISTAQCFVDQRYDGYYNNLIIPSLGSAGKPLKQNISTVYSDYTYNIAGRGRPSPRLISQQLFSKTNRTYGQNSRNLTAMFAFFGELVALELIDTDESTCPVELLSIPVPRCDLDFDPHCTGEKYMPYERVAYDKKTGQSPNTPRKQVNKATSYIDASFVYGNSQVRALYLQDERSAKLASGDSWFKYPERNKEGLPFVANPDPVQHTFTDMFDLWKLGDKHVQENPAVLSLAILFFRWHNYLVDRVDTSRHHSNDETFARVRHLVIASLQNIIMYEWLPTFLGESLPPYKGYRSDIYPDVTSVFDAAAIRYLMTLMPAAIYQRTETCESVTQSRKVGLRLCNTFWKSQELLMEREDAVEETLMGLTSQLADDEDMAVVEDLQRKYFGPLHFSRHDLVSQTIMRGRDYGLPDYNTVRQQIGLDKLSNFEEINPWLNATDPEAVSRLQALYGSVDNIDVFVGGMFETTSSGPGPLFRSILLDQFTRIRDGDRFWFENTNNGVFTEEEIAYIRTIRLHDIIANASRVDAESIPLDVFRFGNSTAPSPCPVPVYADESTMEPCTGHKGYDYFAGSEASYIIVFVSFGLIPFLCLLVMFVLSRCKQWRYMRDIRALQKNVKDAIDDPTGGSLGDHRGTEWQGPDESRPVVIRLRHGCQLQVINLKGKPYRTINLEEMGHVSCALSSNKQRNVILIRVPREYDLVLQVRNDSQRRLFVESLHHVLEEHGGSLDYVEVKLKHIYKTAFTRKKRNRLLETFFKTVFAEAFQMDYSPSLDQTEVEMRQTRDILEIELTKEEFASALAMKPNTEFVENMFSLMDTDRNGYISFREFLNAIVMLSKGSGQNKLQTLFRMFDHNGSGTLDREDLLKLFSSLLEMADSSLSRRDVEILVESICQEHGLTGHDDINFDDFCTILSPHMDKLWNAGLEWKGCKNFIPNPAGDERRKRLPRSANNSPDLRSAEARKRVGQTGDLKPEPSVASSAESSSIDEQLKGLRYKRRDAIYVINKNELARIRFVAIRERYTPLKARIRRMKYFVENNRQHIFYLLIFFGICFGLFAERFYYYSVEREHSGLRALMGYGLSMTRGAAAVMSFCFSLLLLTMLRNTITFLRGTFLNLYAPFDSIVTFHKVVAWTALFFTAVHVVGYGFNFYHLATQPTKYLCVFDTVVFRADILPSFNFWFFGNPTGFTGLLLVICICVIYVFATQTARRLIFNAFWLSHKLIVIMYVLTILHGASMIVQRPTFFMYFVGPAVWFTVDKVISLSRKRMEISIVRAENLASDVTYIEFKRPPRFEYKSGQWVRIACLSLGPNEYHPFTLTSAPHEDTLSVHVRALGPWTYGLRNLVDADQYKQSQSHKLYLDGPYGAGQQDWYTYDVSVLVGAGIGVTPYASILKDFVHMTSIKSTYKIRCQKLYFIWITGSQRHFEWLLDILQEVEQIDTKGMVSIDIFITQFFQNFDLRTAMLYICEEHFQKLSGGRSVFTSLKANTHFGRPHLPSMFKTVHMAHPMVRKVGVFSCGPPGVTKSVERACVEGSRSTKAMFEHHFENF